MRTRITLNTDTFQAVFALPIWMETMKLLKNEQFFRNLKYLMADKKDDRSSLGLIYAKLQVCSAKKDFLLANWIKTQIQCFWTLTVFCFHPGNQKNVINKFREEDTSLLWTKFNLATKISLQIPVHCSKKLHFLCCGISSNHDHLTSCQEWQEFNKHISENNKGLILMLILAKFSQVLGKQKNQTKVNIQCFQVFI